MVLLVDQDASCANHLALEETLFLTDEDYMILYVHDKALVVGKHQNTYREIDVLKAMTLGIPYFRRITGGGTVYHDQGVINFSLIKTIVTNVQREISTFLEALVNFFSLHGLQVTVGKRNELLLDDKKISGTAQHIWKNRFLFHGTLLVDANLDLLHTLLKKHDLRYNDVKINSVPSPVVNLYEYVSYTVDEWIEAIKLYFFQIYGFSEIQKKHLPVHVLDKVNHLLETKYLTWSWNVAYHATYDFYLAFNPASVDAVLQVRNGQIYRIVRQDNTYCWVDELVGLKHEPAVIQTFLQSKGLPLDWLKFFF